MSAIITSDNAKDVYCVFVQEGGTPEKCRIGKVMSKQPKLYESIFHGTREQCIEYAKKNGLAIENF